MKAERPRSGLVLALGLFTVLPVPSASELGRPQAAAAMRSFPLVGLLLGSFAAGLWWLAHWLGAPVLGAVLALGLLVLLTGALHLDGVADTADGLGSRKDAATALAIMKRSDIGPMGVISLVLLLLIQVTALTAISSPVMTVAALLLGPVVGRLAIVFATSQPNDSARPGGFGSLFEAVTNRSVAVLSTVAVLLWGLGLGYVVGGWSGAGLLSGSAGLGIILASAWERHLRSRFGGLTGDTYGSILEWSQTAVWVTIALGSGLLT